MEQLRFEGIEFARTLESVGAFYKALTEEIRAAMEQQPIILRFDGWGEPNPQPRLFEVDTMYKTEDQG